MAAASSDASAQREPILLTDPLTLRSAFRFPLQTAESRREVMRGALWLLVPGVGWILNMGHRISMVHRMQHGQPAWPAWRDHPALFRHGLVTLLGMMEYYAPALICAFLAWRGVGAWLWWPAAALGLAASAAVPGYMSHYCKQFDSREIFDPFRALSRVFQAGGAYWRAWGIALCALALSFTGLLALGAGFLVTSVWFWQVAGFSFASVFTQKFGLTRLGASGSGTGPNG